MPAARIAGAPENLHALLAENHIRRGMVEGEIQHELDTALIRRRGEILKSGHGGRIIRRGCGGVGQVSVIVAGVERVDLPKITDRVGTARVVGRLRCGVGLPSVQTLRMEGLEPNPVDPEILEPSDIHPLGRVMKILEGAAGGKSCGSRIGIGHMDLVNPHLPGNSWCHHDRMVANPRIAQPGPGVSRVGAVAGGDTISPGLEHRQIEFIGAVIVRVCHGISPEISAGLGGGREVAVGRKNAVLNAVIVEIVVRQITVVQVGENLDLRGHSGIKADRQNGKRDIVVLVDVVVRLGVVPI